MENIRDSVLRCICENSDDDDRLIVDLRYLIEEFGENVYSVIIHVLTHLEIDEKKAKACWEEILIHREYLSAAVGRRVNLRTATCDYFCSVKKSLNNPVVVELHIFESNSYSAKYDALTGLHNRSSFDEALNREMARAKRHRQELSFLFFDMDDFKKVNDRYGHTAGDEALKTVAEIIRKESRCEDIAARYGGEEMVVILPETGKAKAFILGERIREKVASTRILYGESRFGMTVSGGIAAYPMDAEEGEELVRKADKALYRAKADGKNQIAFYSHEKRRFIRIGFPGSVSIRQIGIDEIEPTYAASRNLSMGGILVETDFQFEIGTRVRLNIPFEGEGNAVSMFGTVVRVEIFDDNRYDIGVSFLGMDNSAENEIFRYLLKQIERPIYGANERLISMVYPED